MLTKYTYAGGLPLTARQSCVVFFPSINLLSKQRAYRLRFDKVTESLKVGTFLRHSVCTCMCLFALQVRC